MKSFVEDTIVGISTKLGTSAISIIRLSGPKAIEYVNSCFKKFLVIQFTMVIL